MTDDEISTPRWLCERGKLCMYYRSSMNKDDIEQPWLILYELDFGDGGPNIHKCRWFYGTKSDAIEKCKNYDKQNTVYLCPQNHFYGFKPK